MAGLGETTSVSRLVCNFRDVGGNAVRKSFNYAKPDLTDAAAKSLMDVIIENGRAFNTAPDEKVSASLITTTTKPLDVSDE